MLIRTHGFADKLNVATSAAKIRKFMPTNYSKEQNERLYRSVKNYNARLKRLKAKGVKIKNQPVKVYDIKSRYKNKSFSSLEQELKRMDKLTAKNKNVNKIFATAMGGKINQYEFDYLKQYANDAYKFFEEKREYLKARLGRFPSEVTRIKSNQVKMDVLSQMPDTMTQSELNTYAATIREYLQYPQLQRSGYRGFLTEVDLVMQRAGYDEKTINRIHNKLKQLNPEQFTQMYQNTDVIDRVYDLADSPTYANGVKLNTTMVNAREILDSFIEKLDSLVAEYKEW